jgi:hypothetical protein
VFLLREGIKKEAEKMVQQVLQGQGQIGQVQSNAAACRIQVT